MSATGDRLYDALEPLHDGDALPIYAEGYAQMLAPVDELVSDDGDVPGYAHHIFDVDDEPADWLPVTEAFVGITPYPAVDEAGQRLRIKQTDGRFRGTPGAIKGAARQFLVGPDGTPESATVYLLTRVASVATDYTVTVLASECPDPDATEAALEEQRPGGFSMTFSTIVGGDLQTLRDTHTDLAEIALDFTDLDDIRSDPSQT